MTASLESIRYDYVTANLPLREIGKKYGMSKDAVSRLAKKYGWDIEKKSIEKQIVKAARQKSATKANETKKRLKSETEIAVSRENVLAQDVVPTQEDVDKRVALYRATDTLLELVQVMLDTAEAMAPRDLQSMSSTLLNIKQLRDIKPDDEDESKAKVVEVKLEGPLDEWAG